MCTGQLFLGGLTLTAIDRLVPQGASEPISNIPPAEAEVSYYAELESRAAAA